VRWLDIPVPGLPNKLRYSNIERPGRLQDAKYKLPLPEGISPGGKIHLINRSEGTVERNILASEAPGADQIPLYPIAVVEFGHVTKLLRQRRSTLKAVEGTSESLQAAMDATGRAGLRGDKLGATRDTWQAYFQDADRTISRLESTGHPDLESYKEAVDFARSIILPGSDGNRGGMGPASRTAGPFSKPR
jgi:hypothetical protein